MLVDPQLLNRIVNDPDHQKQLGTQLMKALAAVVRSSDYNVSYPSAPLGRAEAIDALRSLNLALKEACNVVPGVDVPLDQESDMFGGFEPDQEEREARRSMREAFDAAQRSWNL